jgi:hypothetical protein
MTVTEVEQLAVTRAASLAVQVTGVVPIGNWVPEEGEQTVETGAVPPVTIGSS